MTWGGRRVGAGRKRNFVSASPRNIWIPDLVDRVRALPVDRLSNRAVLALRAYGADVLEIAAVLNTTSNEVLKSYRDELLQGETLCRGNLVWRLVDKARKGSAAALIALHRLISAARTRESAKIEIT
jgi:hypothetical protein